MPGRNADDWPADTRTSYDTVAVDYADRLRGVLAGAPYLRAALALFADLVRAARGGPVGASRGGRAGGAGRWGGPVGGGPVGGGPVADVGCGPGHVTDRLRELGLDVFGIDLPPGMIEVAPARAPRPAVRGGLDDGPRLADASVAGLLAFWSLIRLPDEAVPAVLDRFRGCCAPADHCCSASTSASGRA
ncbi:class I SAM-dependent methyltransferase [Kitasatospora sp. NPDC059673]|uniref:class I SAM-dependent methyltransferase n=1 Tax=Kitasatospora sp. NPDC059673 TaxID=3346901 RepID=UPI00369A32B1